MKKLALIAASAATLGLVVLGTSPAMAAQTRTLPANNTAYLFDCQDNLGYGGIIDVATSVVTAIGPNTPTANTSCAGQASFDVTTGDIYWISWSHTETLMKLDKTTGQSSEVAPFSASDGANAMAINNEGQAYAIENNDGTNPSGEKLYSLNLTDGTMTYIANIQGLGGNNCVWSAAFNPIDDQLYISCYSDTGVLVKVNLTDGSTTNVCTSSAGQFAGIAFDSDGIMWAAMGASNASFASFDISEADCGPQTGDATTITGASPDYTDGASWFSESIAIAYGNAPTPALPDTGASAGTLVAIAYTAGGLFVLAAAALVTRAVLRRRKA